MKPYSIPFRFIATASLLTAVALQAHADDTANFTLPSGVNFRIVEAPFNKSNFKIEGCSEHERGCKINGHIPFGTDFTIPTSYVKSIDVSFAGKTHKLDASDMYDAWRGRPLAYQGTKIRYFGGKCYDNMSCQFRGLFSDGAGTFVAEWRVVDGFSMRTALTDSSDVVGIFMEHIDPPYFD